MRTFAACIVTAHSGIAAFATAAEITSEQSAFFENKIRPVLAENCYQCHNSVDKKKGDIALDYRAAVLESKVIVPGDPEKSPLIQAIRHAEDYEPMPSKSPKLAKLIIKNFEDWVRMGAPDPRLEKPTKEELEGQVDWAAVRDRRAGWWSFRPIVKSDPPKADDPEWDRGAIDRFIYDGLKDAGLKPAAVADPGTLVRRLHLILTGLPPKPEVVAGFVENPSEEAYVALVDELIASPQFGERWARYWMDWYRYAESHGSEGDPAIPYVNRYRDYLIRAINADVPYDQMIREHLAGDLLENPRINEELGLNESAIGPAQFRMVPHGFGVTDAYDEQITFTDNQIDVVSKAMLGITISCARCHNHKFDPISQKDYYKFYGIMISSRPAIVNVDSPKLQDLHRTELEKLKGEIRDQFGAHWLGEVDAAINKLEKANLGKVADSHPLGAWAHLKEVPAEAFTREIDRRKAAYEDGLQHNEKAKAGATFYADLRDQATYDRWFKSGNGPGSKVSPAGSFAVAGEGKNTFTGAYPAGVYSHMISDRHSGFLNSVFHLAEGNGAAIRAFGNNANARFTMRSYPLMHGGLHPAPGLKPQIGWVGVKKYKYWNGERGYFQINTGPDSTFRAGGGRSWFGVLEAYAGDDGMRELGAPLVALPGDLGKITDRASLLEFYRGALRAAVAGWRSGKMTDAEALLLDAFVSRGFLANEVAKLPANLKPLVDGYRKLESEIREPVRAPGVVEGEPWDQPLLERGSYKKEGEPVERAFLEVIPGKTYTKKGSGRLELAEDILAEGNPLTARVMVNRLWHHTFGRGIVASADNFGRLGKEPTHPKLLDHLAADFRESGWSMKGFIRKLVMSRAFRSASSAPASNGDKDPENLRLAYFTPRRLDAEAILDTIRFVASNNVPRRAVYNGVRRNALDRFLTTFNFPIPTTTVGVRNVTNVPAQSLTLMNGQTSRQAAQQWSRRINSDAKLTTHGERIDALFMQAYARHATPEEIDACLVYITGKAEDDSGELFAKHRRLLDEVKSAEAGRAALIKPVRNRLQAEVDRRNAAIKASAPKAVDLKPIARWDFEGDAKDAAGAMHGRLTGKSKIEDGALVLGGGMVATAPLPKRLGAKSLEVLVQLDNIDQRGGGAMTVQTTSGSVFDGIVYAEVDGRTWLSGSDHHHRTDRFQAPPEADAGTRPVRIVMVYEADGTTRCYRDGKPYGKPYKKGRIEFEAGRSQVVFGIRHGTAPDRRRMLTGKIFEARLYDRALTATEAAAASSGTLLEVVTADELAAALSGEQKEALADFDEKLSQLRADAAKLGREIAERERARGGGGDAYSRIAHAILNSKELIYVY